MDRNIGKNISSSNRSSKQSQKLLDCANQSPVDALKTASKRVIQKTAEAIGDVIGNKIAGKITRVSKLHHRIIQKQMKMKYLEKDIHLQN